MKRCRALASVLLLCASLSLPGIALASPPSSGDEDIATAQDCVLRERGLSVLFLVDTSSSLEWSNRGKSPGTDPEGLRADTLEAVIELLHTPLEVGQRVGDQLRIEVSFLDFGSRVRDSFQELIGWRSLDEVYANLDLLKNFKKKFNDQDTDYVGALEPRKSITDESSGDGQVGAIQRLDQATYECKVLVWITDGGFEFDPGTARTSWSDRVPTPDDGKGFLCKADPRFSGRSLVDQLRQSTSSQYPVYVAAVGLGGKDFSLLREIAEGGCGSAKATGQFVNASHPEDLLKSLANILIPTVTPPRAMACAGQGQVRKDSIFFLGDGVDRINLLLSASVDQTNVNLIKWQDPSASSVQFQIPLIKDGQIVSTPTGASPGISNVSVKEIFRVGKTVYLLMKAELESRESGRAWVGNWSVEFCRPSGLDKVDAATVYVYGGLTATLETKEVTADRSEQLVVRLRTRSGQHDLLDTSHLTFESAIAKVDGRPATVTVGSDARAIIAYRPSIKDIGKPHSIEFETIPSLKFSDQTTGRVAFEPLRYRETFEVMKIPNTPVLIPKPGSNWSPLDRRNSSTRRDFIAKPGEADGNVCFEKPGENAWKFPADFKADVLPTFSIVSGVDRRGCVEVETKDGAGRVVTLEIRVRPEQLKIQTNSQLGFNLEYTASTKSGERHVGAPLAQSIPVFSTLKLSINVWRALAFALLAALVPIVFLWAYNSFYGAQLVVPNRPLYVYRKRLVIDGNSITVDGDPRAQIFRPSDLTLAPVAAGKQRSMSLQNLSLRGRFSMRRPFATPVAEARSDTDRYVIGPLGSDLRRRSGLGSLALDNAWYVEVDRSDDAAVNKGGRKVELTLLTTDVSTATRVTIDDALDETRRQFAHLDEKADGTDPKTSALRPTNDPSAETLLPRPEPEASKVPIVGLLNDVQTPEEKGRSRLLAFLDRSPVEDSNRGRPSRRNKGDDSDPPTEAKGLL